MLDEPIRIITRSCAASVAAAFVLMAALHEQDKKCSVRVISQYTQVELDMLQREQYNSFFLIECDNEHFKSLEKSRFISIEEAYALQRDCAKKYAYVLAAGYLARYIDHGGNLLIPTEVLEDALRSNRIYSETSIQLSDVDEKFLANLCVRGESKLIDLAETLIACTRMRKSGTLLSALLGEVASKAQLPHILNEYRQERQRAIEFYERTRQKNVVVEQGIILAKLADTVSDYMAGSLAAHLFHKQDYEDGTFILVMARNEARTRFSLRVVGNRKDINLKKLTHTMMEGISSHNGGTQRAAGGIFSFVDEERFIAAAQKFLGQAFVEESITQ